MALTVHLTPQFRLTCSTPQRHARNETTMVYDLPTMPESRARAVVGVCVFHAVVISD